MRRNQSLPPNKQIRSTILPQQLRSRASSMAPLPDQRPAGRDIKSKAFINRAVTALVEFLAASDYPNKISTRILQCPNAKDVFCIFEHLVRQVDPTFRLKNSGLKPEEMCINTLRELGYPFTLSKQNLATPYAPHAWPSVLAALDWLREEVFELSEFVAGDGMFKYDDDQVKEEEPIGRVLYEISLCGYHAIRTGEEINPSTVELFGDRMRHVFGCVSQDELRQLQSRDHKLQSELNTAAGFDSEIESLRATLFNLDEQLEAAQTTQTRFEHLIEQLEPEFRRISAETDSLTKEEQSLQERLHGIKKQLEAQEASGYGRLEEEYQMLTERYNARLKTKSELIRETERLQLEFSRREGRVAPAFDGFNRLIGSIRAPGFEQIAKDCDLKIRTYQAGFDIKTDFPAVVTAARSNLDRFRSAVLAAEERVASISQDIEEIRAAIEKLDVTGARAHLSDLQERAEKIVELLEAEELANEETKRDLSEKRNVVTTKSEELRVEEATLKEQLADLKVSF
ncbi:hypothetical protein FBUS_10184 [Fasciolopsis buskii]|uniref:Kinetochore protein NDC80 n=1 Tax=Fasciolopsis buskii TaxID=27845 RepID=A0A8E0RY97_9TREM|nr:hypothetical protein FBUS_10184 [Fasciolopsis buski]